MFVREKAEQQLKDAQGKATTRTLTIDQVERMIKQAEEWLSAHDTPKWALKYIRFQYQEKVCNAYNYIADATELTITFTQKGTAKTVSFARKPAQSAAYGGEIKRLVLDTNAMLACEYLFRPENTEQQLLAGRFATLLGFKHQGTISI